MFEDVSMELWCFHVVITRWMTLMSTRFKAEAAEVSEVEVLAPPDPGPCRGPHGGSQRGRSGALVAETAWCQANVWFELSPTGTGTKAYQAATAWDSTNKRMYLFAGVDNTGSRPPSQY